MKIKKKIFLSIYFFLYLSLIFGFYINEDSAGGFIKDYDLHFDLTNKLFNNSIIYGFLNYDIYYVPHSPLFILYLIIIKKFFVSEFLLRLFHLHLCLLIPYFIFLAIKIKYKTENYDLKLLLPTIFFLSPYFRAGGIWVDDNIFALIFLSISIFYFVKEKFNHDEHIKFILLNVLFLAIASYFRPIYSILSIFFFVSFFDKIKLYKNLLFYIVFNLILSLPAFYYIFILEINKWATSYLFRVNFITTFSLVMSVMMFYILPIILFHYKTLITQISNLKIFIISIIYFFSLYLFFQYNVNYSGGIFLKASKFIFYNNIFFYFLATTLTIFFYLIFFKKNKSYLDLILIGLLFLLEIDGIVYHETYDPLLIIIMILIFENQYISNFFKKLNLKSFLFLFCYFLTFLILSILKVSFL